MADATGRQRTQTLLDNAIAARAGQSTKEGFQEFTGSLKQALKNK